MDFIKEKIKVMRDKLHELSVIEKLPLNYEYVACPEYKKTNTPPKEGYIPADGTVHFDGVDTHFWIHTQIEPIARMENKEVRFCVKTGREGQWDACNPQIIAYLNGKNVQGMDINHTWIPLSYGEKCDIYLYLYTGTGLSEGDFYVELSKETKDLAVEALYFDIDVPFEALNCLDEKSYDYKRVRDALDKATQCLDLRDFYSKDFYKSLEMASEVLRCELYKKQENTGTICCIGHTHIDVAWLWTLAQTREKAQRSFATVLSLMKRYGEYTFMSSQPELYQMVKEEDPELYGRIRKAIGEGVWEPEGGMWLEADTNIAGGESLIRQFLYGKRFMMEEFGVDNTILWLPDVFGYSGSLPQIMKKCGISRFFTTKLYWNESNDMPNDTFYWEGIDGSRVFAHFQKGYVNTMTADTVYNAWYNYKNQSLTANRIYVFGHGDGGGGPTAEMIERYKRFNRGIPGMPNVEMTKSAKCFEMMEEEFEKNTKALGKKPKWVGEMYLEMHRGTYTTIAKNKKNNRKSELMFMTAEALSVGDMILFDGEYPKFDKGYRKILVNQFHDILPGSSIKSVYDNCDKEYAEILSYADGIISEKLANIKKNLNTDGGILVYNPTPFERCGKITCGENVYCAENIPSHGYKVIEPKAYVSKTEFSGNVLENDVISLTFDKDFHIVSVYDKAEKREILSGKGNVLEVFEDYPREYDAWEISSYYTQKKWIADDVTDVVATADGIKITRKYGKSQIEQEIRLENGSKRVDFVTDIDWHEDHVLLKAAFETNIRNSFATYDIQFGNVERPTYQNTSWDEAKFEVCAHKWADLSENNYGVSLLNDCKYGYSIEDGVMKISLLKAPTYPNPDADRGKHSFTYSLYPHTGDFRGGRTVVEGYALNMPLICENVGKMSGAVPSEYSLMSSNMDNVIVEAIKKAEDDGSVIVRVYESYNQKERATITAGFDFSEVYLCDMLENELEKLNADGRCVDISISNFEILTLKFKR